MVTKVSFLNKYNKSYNSFFWTNVAANKNRQTSLEGWTLDEVENAEANYVQECNSWGFWQIKRKNQFLEVFINLLTQKEQIFVTNILLQNKEQDKLKGQLILKLTFLLNFQKLRSL
ncbi:unnamed protein product (macronuclear) [Paramecium tetraurelia]|uniref:Uncharacterized protein n=1 Tax=Paramecium tetraurelia TaxID=5888 RepID=A0DFV3_PARTE|nr:uncharacterized protein GSPATT00039482001 [Paramecium tetraurelia]CAK81920.1 unnamed protein product [Paramecium tetraurelia]|eukprot:XP_001449317.1 hypothetical protein (macronuclear) [Paramecium tetraurelia strain d4-2]